MADLGRVGSAYVEVGADLSALGTALKQSVSQSKAAGQEIATALQGAVRVDARALSGFADQVRNVASSSVEQLNLFRSTAEAVGPAVAHQLSFVSDSLGSISVTARDSMAQFRPLTDQLRGFGAEIASSIGRGIDSLQGLRPVLNQIGTEAQGLGTALSIGVSVPLVSLGAAAIDAFRDIDALQRGLVATAGSAEIAQRQFAELREVARLPGLGLEEAVRGSINLQNFGFSAQLAKDTLMGFGNALATVGRGRAELDRVIMQLGQMAGAGRVLMQDLRPIIQTVPQVAGIIRREFGPEALSEPQETLDRLGVTAEEFIGTLVTELNKLPKVTGGLKNDLENLADTVRIALSKIGAAMEPLITQVIAVVVPMLESAVDAFTSLPAPIQQTAIVIAGLAAAAGPVLIIFGSMARGMSDLIGLMGTLRTASVAAGGAQGLGALAAGGNAAAAAMTLLRGGIIAALVVLGAGAMLDTARDTATAWESFKKSIDDLIPSLDDASVKIKEVDEATKSGAESAGFFERVWAGIDWQNIIGPMGSLDNLLKDLADKINMLRGRFPEMDEHVRRAAEGMQSLAMETMKVSEESLLATQRASEQAKANNGLSTSAAEVVAEHKKSLDAYSQAKTVYHELLEAYRNGLVPIEAVNRAQAAMEAAHKKTTAAVKEQKQTFVDLSAAFENIYGKGSVTDPINFMRDAMLKNAEAAKTTQQAVEQLGTSMTATMENGVRVIRGNTEAFDANTTAVRGTADATRGMTVSVENGVTVIRGAAIAKEAAADAARTLAESNEGAARSYEELAATATAASNRMRNLPFSSRAPGVGTGDVPAGAGMPTDLLQWLAFYLAGAASPATSGFFGLAQPARNTLQAMGYTALGQNTFVTQADLDAMPQFSASIDDVARSADRATDRMDDFNEALREEIKASPQAEESVEDLTDQLWRLIDAGRGSSDEAWALRNRISELTSAVEQVAVPTVRATGSLGGFTTAVGSLGRTAQLAAVTSLELTTAAAVQLSQIRERTRSFLGPSTPGTPTSNVPTSGSGAPPRSYLEPNALDYWGRMGLPIPGSSGATINVYGGTFSSNAFLEEIGEGLNEIVRRDAGGNL